MCARFFFWVILYVLCVCTSSSKIQTNDVAETLKKVPDAERLDFLRYHVNHGYMLKRSDVAYKYQVGYSDEFSVDLYDYFVETHTITDQNAVAKAQNQVCFPSGSCIDIDDPGVHPS